MKKTPEDLLAIRAQGIGVLRQAAAAADWVAETVQEEEEEEEAAAAAAVAAASEAAAAAAAASEAVDFSPEEEQAERAFKDFVRDLLEDCGSRSVTTARDELVSSVEGFLGGRDARRFLCFAAYHGIDGRDRRTLGDIGERGSEYGFRTSVTRERVQQVLAEAEDSLRRKTGRKPFARWAEAVGEARERVPGTVERIVDAFGYGSGGEESYVFLMLREVADMLGLEFPFNLRTIHGRDFVSDGTAANAAMLDVVQQLMGELGERDWYEVAAVAAAVGHDAAVLEKVVRGAFGWEFLNEEHRYFWTRPRLPPRNHGKTGNAILNGLCKVFSVAREASTLNLAAALPRDRGLRRMVPREVVEGIGVRSGLFDLEGGILRRRAGQTWFCLGKRELQAAQVCVEHGRVVSSQILRSSLVRYGLSSKNAAAVMACTPLLVHTKAGRGREEGIYKLICTTEEAVAALRVNGWTERLGEGASVQDEGWKGILRIPVSSRVRLRGDHFAGELDGMDGEWRVHAADGTFVGAVTISDGVVGGLGPVVNGLGLELNEVLELKRGRDGELLADRA